MAYLKAPKPKELSPADLKWTCDPEIFEFESTFNLKPIEGIIGQERAIKALKLGVELKSPGYNIFITGLSGTGKATTVKQMLESISPECPKLFDYAYVNNFKDPDQPTLLIFPAGKGCKFKTDITAAIKFLQENIPQVLDSEPFVSQKKKILSDFGARQQTMMQTFEEKLRKDKFSLGQIKIGEFTRPEILIVIGDQQVFIQQLDEFVASKKITKRQATQITKKYAAYQEELHSVFKKSLNLTQEFQQKVIDLERATVDHIISATIGELKSKYKIEKVKKYLDELADNISENLDVFKGHKAGAEPGEDGPMAEDLREYEVNLILDNSGVKECPVIIETSPTYSKLFGIIEKYSDGSGGWYADFTKIKGGSILRANGGYLVINAMDAFTEPGVWKTLKRLLLYGILEIQDFPNLYQYTPSILKPEPIQIDTKVIMIGNNYIYHVLSNYEDDFKKIFKVKSEFDYEMKRTNIALVEYARVIKKMVEKEKLLEFDKNAIAKIVEYGARYAGEKSKLTTQFAYIADLVREANFWANDSGNTIITAYHVEQAYEFSRDRHGLNESKISEMIGDGTILIDSEGSKTGQINGLAVYSSGFYAFGKPTRITASVSIGSGDIVNVEREAGLSGKTHNKGVLIISGYFREKFGRKMPLSFKANLVFEQGYGMIDGDSASITEICALLSSLSEIPINQSLAITGSVNQKGDIQPIGGVNEKIEGYFDICKSRGLNKKHGVIIPRQNVKDLMLKNQVVEAVEKKEFHIYHVSTVEEAVEILTGVRAGKLLPSGRYQANTIYGVVEKNLRDMKRRSKESPAKKDSAKKKTTRKKK